jgi:sugar lactone lactonase YvrE
MSLRAITTGLLTLTLGACVDDPPCGANPGELCLLVGTGQMGFNADGLSPRETDLYLVSAARRGPDDRLYIMDFNNQRLRRIDDAGLVETIVGSGFHAIADTEVPLLDTPLENPIDFDFVADGRLVFVSYHDPRVLVLGADGTLDAIAGAGDGITGVVGNEGDGGPASAALFIQLDGIAIADDDTIYVSDSMANRVRKIEDGIIDTVAGTGEIGYSGDGGPGSEAALHWPTALELDADGNLYIADTFNHAIRRLAPDGTITTVAGTGVEGPAGDGGPATAAQLNQPFGLAIDEDGTIYIGDRANFRVRRVSPDGVIDTIAGIGREGIGTEGPAGASELGYLARVALDGDELLIADQSNGMIWRLRLR